MNTSNFTICMFEPEVTDEQIYSWTRNIEDAPTVCQNGQGIVTSEIDCVTCEDCQAKVKARYGL